ncbi:MAG: hypothetical protein A2W31_14550 [Planctomycetes bacterium RBG_16_64_10]|nr:MAG: hypothetical protein A2W31_14550 [Planctomycetes bacterium RBG_16_64_10]
MDDSDEPKRRAKGLRSKRDQRRYLLWEALCRHAALDQATVNLACDVADAAFNTVWHDQHVTWTVETRLRVVLAGLGRSLPAGELAAVVRDYQMMEVDIVPDLVPGCRDALAVLAGRFKLAVVSDAIVTPGSHLRLLLDRHGIKDYFSGFAFSDEVGHSKPHRAMFAAAAQQLDVPIDEMIHIGDRDHNDIQGAQALGMKAVLLAASRAVDQPHTSADAVCRHYRDLPGIIDRLLTGAIVR